MKPQIAVVDIIAAVHASIAAEPVGLGGVLQVAPVGDNIVFIPFGPDIGLDGEDDLFVLGVGDAGEDGGHVGLAVFAGVEGEIGGQDTRKARLEGIAGDGEGGDVELTLFLRDGIDSFGLVSLEPGPADVNQVYLIVFQGVLSPACCSQEQ